MGQLINLKNYVGNKNYLSKTFEEVKKHSLVLSGQNITTYKLESLSCVELLAASPVHQLCLVLQVNVEAGVHIGQAPSIPFIPFVNLIALIVFHVGAVCKNKSLVDIHSLINIV